MILLEFNEISCLFVSTSLHSSYTLFYRCICPSVHLSLVRASYLMLHHLLFLYIYIQVRDLSLADVEMMFKNKIVVAKDAIPGSSNYTYYHHIQRLHFVSNTNKVILAHFFCTSCKNILNIDTTSHHNDLKRHYEKCFETDSCMKIASKDIKRLVSTLTQIGAKYGAVDAKRIPIPDQLSSEHV